MIGSYAGAILIVAGFTWLFLRLHVVEHTSKVNGIVRQSVATAADRSLSDDAKARAMRGHSLALFGIFANLIFRLALAVGLPILLVWLLAFTRLWTFQGALEATLTWPFLVAGLLPFVLAFLRFERRREG